MPDRYRVVCDGLPDVVLKTLKYARSVRDNHEGRDCHIEELIDGSWQRIE